MWNLKYGTNEPICKAETDSNIKNRFVVAKGERGGRKMDWEFGVSRYTLLHAAWINHNILLHSTRTIFSFLAETIMEINIKMNVKLALIQLYFN